MIIEEETGIEEAEDGGNAVVQQHEADKIRCKLVTTTSLEEVLHRLQQQYPQTLHYYNLAGFIAGSEMKRVKEQTTVL